MQTVAIVGVGLIGASFGLATRKAGFNGTILGVSSEAAIRAGLEAGAISGASTLREAAATADLIYLAQPVDRIIETIVALGPIARKEALITDAGSTKTEIVRTAHEHVNHACFIGGHPMTGKEVRGAQAADADLFRNRPYVLTPLHEPVPASLTEMLSGIGANVIEMSAVEHDETVAFSSHLPQLISTALAFYLAEQSKSNIQLVHGAGLLDMTRLAMSPLDLWESILATNKASVKEALSGYSRVIAKLEKALDDDTLAQVFERAAEFTSKLRKPSN